MGNDGGSIPKRRELVKSAARTPTHSELKAINLESLEHAWTHDPLTTAPLDLDAVVSDWRGTLYNYESILRNLLPSDADADSSTQLETPDDQTWTFASTGIKSLRDIVKLKLKLAHPADKEEKRRARVCPVSLKELGPGTRTVYLVPCGHVFAEVAIRQIQREGVDEETCPECSEPFKADNVLPVLPVDEADVKRLTQRMEGLRAARLTHSLKKDKSAAGEKKKNKKRKAGEQEAKEGAKDDNASAEKRRATEAGVEAAKDAPLSRTRGINNAMAASLTARVMAEQEELSKRRKLAARA